MASVVRVAFEDVTLQAFADRARTQDEQVVVRGQPRGDLHDKSLEVLEAVRLARGLDWPTAPVADAGIVPDVAGGLVMCRHLGLHPLESSSVVLPADDDGFPRVDPDEGGGSRRFVDLGRLLAVRRRHERAQMGPSSASTARSA